MAAAGRLTGPEWQRCPDPATEWEVSRLTDAGFASGMTAPHLPQFSRRADSLLYWSERSGSRQAWLLDLKAGGSRQVTESAGLDAGSLCLSPDERTVRFFDGAGLNETSLRGLQNRVVYRVGEGAVRAGMTVASDGSVVFAENRAGRWKLVRVQGQRAVTVGEGAGEVDLALARPRHAEVLYHVVGGVKGDGSGGRYGLANPEREMALEPGVTGEAIWAPSGRTLLYLHVPGDAKELITLREKDPEEGSDRVVARTSQFATVSPNGDASVFAGASRSRASAYVLILLRVTRRELTLCEHGASDPAMVSPVFSPDSRNVFFVSDRHGKPALYRVGVDRFVEETG